MISTIHTMKGGDNVMLKFLLRILIAALFMVPIAIGFLHMIMEITK